jgi:hypothetical protein
VLWVIVSLIFIGLILMYVETFVIEFVLVLLSSTIPNSDFNSASTTSASFRWLLLFPSGDSDRFALICAHFASVTALSDLLREPSHLFDPFPIICNYFINVLVCFGSIVGEPTPFLFIRLSTPFFFWMRSGNDPLL